MGKNISNYIPLVWASIQFNLNQRWKNKIYKLGKVDDRISTTTNFFLLSNLQGNNKDAINNNLAE